MLDRARGVRFALLKPYPFFDEGRRVASCLGVRRGEHRGRRSLAGYGWLVRRSGGVTGPGGRRICDQRRN